MLSFKLVKINNLLGKSLNQLEATIKILNNNILITANPDVTHNISWQEYINKWKELSKQKEISIVELTQLVSEGATHPLWLEFWYELSKKKTYTEVENYIYEYSAKRTIMTKEEIEQAKLFCNLFLLKNPPYNGIYSSINNIFFDTNTEAPILELLDKNGKKHLINLKNSSTETTIELMHFLGNYFTNRSLKTLETMKNN